MDEEIEGETGILRYKMGSGMMSQEEREEELLVYFPWRNGGINLQMEATTTEMTGGDSEETVEGNGLSRISTSLSLEVSKRANTNVREIRSAAAFAV